MPEYADVALYRERAAKWRAAADALPPSDTRTRASYINIAESYLRLAELLEHRSWPVTMGSPEQDPLIRA